MTNHPEPRSPDEPLAAEGPLSPGGQRYEDALEQVLHELRVCKVFDDVHDDSDGPTLTQRLRAGLAELGIDVPLRAALAVTRPEPDLDAAWREAEAASGGGRMSLHCYEDGNYEASCWPLDRMDTLAVSGPTPAAALLSLASTLRSTKPG